MSAHADKADVWPPPPSAPSPSAPFGMTEEQVGRVEVALELVLPGFYRDTMTDLPGPLSDIEPLCDDPEALIEHNRFNRKHFDWPSHYFAVGSDGAGNDFYLDLSRDDHTVYFADHHEGGENLPVETDFVAWVREVAEGWAEYEAAQQALEEERRRNKKWWQTELWR